MFPGAPMPYGLSDGSVTSSKQVETKACIQQDGKLYCEVDSLTTSYVSGWELLGLFIVGVIMLVIVFGLQSTSEPYDPIKDPKNKQKIKDLIDKFSGRK